MKKFSIISAILVFFLILADGAVGNYFYNYALNTDQEKNFIEGNPNLAESEAVGFSVSCG